MVNNSLPQLSANKTRFLLIAAGCDFEDDDEDENEADAVGDDERQVVVSMGELGSFKA